mmetsp:Transcript_26018/g.43862  ORF Transcript_26018/g.43862 Transcript_26018/m.43862 type:complete len:570 (-) Transcript_26018:138-1847(-)|eukprot:CAMPEP_0114423306 /NCGR_PEP_ID=MMETSP0103-20121206/6079_1 /TAXON_ID=37642 ORGANISM="Paraphysomonas imperforata, Strain PA2" /NCGR_SAMPLE_ID=MMETSP0103 /ASSEMBLY_ACC=CAM_ASM_000201 /LENGTH=569 /DNA_ID=CAMNT_0001591961 /DNA_START=185 /DNA_END=1894 /DNA_ORIENTATION=+
MRDDYYDDDEEEEVMYLEHGCEYDSSSGQSPSKKKTFHSIISISESDYAAAAQYPKHQEAPSFRRNNHNKGKSNSNGSRPSVPSHVADMLRGCSPSNDDEDGDDDYTMQVTTSTSSESASAAFDFTDYKSKRQLSPPPVRRNGHLRPADLLNTRKSIRNVPDRTSKRGSVASREAVEEELDRPSHWGKPSSGYSSRRASHSSGCVRGFAVASTRTTQQSRRKSAPNSTITVSKPFSLSATDKLTQRKRKQSQDQSGNKSRSILELSFQPSWLPTSSSARRERVVRGSALDMTSVEVTATQEEHGNEPDTFEHTSRNTGFDSPQESYVSFDASFRPPASGTVVTGTEQGAVIPSFSISTSSSPYTSDNDTHERNSINRSRRSNKQSHERHLLPKLLRMKRLHAELEVRFETSLRSREPSAKGRKESKHHFRTGDLQDPRTRTKSRIDVTIIKHEGGTTADNAVIWEQPPFVVLALKVDMELEQRNTCTGNELEQQSTQQNTSGANNASVMGDVLAASNGIVLGYFKSETFSKMSLSVVVGNRLRIYDSVLVPGQEHALPTLLCTTLCEKL